MKPFLPEFYSLSLKQAIIDADHILLSPHLAEFVSGQTELDLGDAGKIRIKTQEEILYARGLVKKLSSLGNLLQFYQENKCLKIRGLMMEQPETNISTLLNDHPVIVNDPVPLIENAWQGRFSSSASFFLAREVSALTVKPGFDQLLSFQIAQGVTLYPHQVNTVKTVLRQMRGRALLCDEVGLGKTVEAGLIAMEYILRGLVKRTLILTPPALVHQWQEEMAQKFNQDFISSDSNEFISAGETAWSRFPNIIASIDLATRAGRAEKITKTRFDLVIVDEAHRLRRRNTAAWKLVNELDKKYILLLTATRYRTPWMNYLT